MANAVWKGHIAFGMVSFPYADSQIRVESRKGA
jgi:non-homologous end joining protein Ku